MTDAAAVESAVVAWRRGVGRLEEPGAARAARWRVVEAVTVELRRRVGPTFTLGQLVDAYDEATGWFTELAARVAPGVPDAWDASVALDGAFGLYARGAVGELPA
ncbi:MAG: hypothetical protein AB1416_04095 [Actinomycetota bacterium]